MLAVCANRSLRIQSFETWEQFNDTNFIENVTQQADVIKLVQNAKELHGFFRRDAKIARCVSVDDGKNCTNFALNEVRRYKIGHKPTID